MSINKHFLPRKLFAVAACVSLFAAIAGQAAQGERVFSGKLGNKYRIQMRLRRDGGKLSGTYFYERFGQDLTLRGEIDAQANFILREYGASGAQTGIFKGTWRPSDCEGCGDFLTGKWSKPDGTGALSFALTVYSVAFRGPLKLVTRSFSEKNRKGQPVYEINVEYPQLEGSTDAAVARFNELIRDKIKKEDSFRNEFREGSKNPSDGGEYDLSYGVGIATDDLISIDFISYFHYAAAGQRNAVSETVNYDLKRGRVIKFEDLFRPGSDYQKLISDYCLRDLRNQYKDDRQMTDELLKTHVDDVVGEDKKWTITPDGLDIIFDSAEIPPSGGGETNVIVPYSVLKRVIQPDGPLAAFAG
jgi:uncharacterized protein DUF3298